MDLQVTSEEEHEALMLFNRIFCDPDNWEGWYHLGLFYLRNLWKDMASKYLEYALKLDPDNPDIFQDLYSLNI